MFATRERYGTTREGATIDLFTLTNARGLTVRCINYGCRIANIVLPLAGGDRDVVLGFDNFGGYERDGTSQGALIGRYAGRIKDASFVLDGRRFDLTKKEDGHFRHGSFNRRIFEADIAGDAVVFTCNSPDGEDGFPGKLHVQARYSLDEENRLTLEYTAQTDRETVINLTNHAYFDFSGGKSRDIEDHILQLNADRFLAIGDGLCPTGEMPDVAGTPFDFREPKRIDADIGREDEQLAIAGGYDHCFVIRKDADSPDPVLAATATDAMGAVALRVCTTQPGVQFYTGNFLNGTTSGKGVCLTRRRGFCLETQHYADSPNHPAFPTTTLKPGEIYRQVTVFEFDF